MTLTMRERREFLARVVRSQLHKLDLKKDGDLVEEIFTDSSGNKRYRLPGKRQCIMDDAKLAGDLFDKADLASNGQPLPSLLPQINFNVPEVWLTRRRGRLPATGCRSEAERP
jgi:hypothetical protein